MDKKTQKNDFKEIAYGFLSKLGVGIFQKIFPEYFAKEPLKPTDRYIEYDFVVRNLPKPPAKVLDVGCAGSFFPLLLAGFGYETYGIDIREYAITNKINFDNFRFLREDIRKTSFADNFFDAVTAVSTIEHIGISGRHGSDEDLDADKKTMTQIKRVIKPGGVVLLTIPFGKAKIIRPNCRIYDEALVKQLTEDLAIEKEEYCIQDSFNDWMICSKSEAANVVCSSQYYSLCLLKLRV